MQMDVYKKMTNVTATFVHMVFLVRNFTWADVCFSEHGCFKTELAEFYKELQTLWILRIGVKSYENTNKLHI